SLLGETGKGSIRAGLAQHLSTAALPCWWRGRYFSSALVTRLEIRLSWDATSMECLTFASLPNSHLTRALTHCSTGASAMATSSSRKQNAVCRPATTALPAALAWPCSRYRPISRLGRIHSISASGLLVLAQERWLLTEIRGTTFAFTRSILR